MQLQLDDDDVQRIARAVVELMPAASSARSPWMDSREAMEYLRLPSLDALHRLTAAGAVPHSKVNGRCLFHRAELDRWLQEHAVVSQRVSTALQRPGNRR